MGGYGLGRTGLSHSFSSTSGGIFILPPYFGLMVSISVCGSIVVILSLSDICQSFLNTFFANSQVNLLVRLLSPQAYPLVGGGVKPARIPKTPLVTYVQFFRNIGLLQAPKQPIKSYPDRSS